MYLGYKVLVTINKPISTIKAKNILTLLSVLIPLSIPDQADHVNNIVAIIINITCVPKLFGTLNRKFRPSFI